MYAIHSTPKVDRDGVASSAADLKTRAERVIRDLARNPDRTRDDDDLFMSLNQTVDTLSVLIHRLGD